MTVDERPGALRGCRVAVVTSRLWDGYNELWDAVEPQVESLTVVGARDSRGPAESLPHGHRLSLRSVDLGRGLVWEHLVGLRRHLRALRPDLIHVNRELWAVVAQEIVGSDAAVVVHGAENLWHHGGRGEQALRSRLVSRAVRRIAGYASWNHAGADHVIELRRELGLGRIPTMVLPAVVPPAPYRQVHWAPRDSGFDVLLVGRLTPEKGFLDVVDAAAGIMGLRLIVCGTGPMRQDLIERARKQRVELRVEGFVSPPALAQLMARAHLMIQPSRTTASWAEQFGRTVAEAMTVGLPCLVSDSGELPYVVGRDARAVFPEGDVHALRARLLQLATTEQQIGLSHRQARIAEAWRPLQAGTTVIDLWRRALS